MKTEISCSDLWDPPQIKKAITPQEGGQPSCLPFPDNPMKDSLLP
jgi:hypothetical protein